MKHKEHVVEKVEKESLNVSELKKSSLMQLFPEVFSEGKIDFERLRHVLGGDIDGREEKYSFTWAGRKEAFRNIQATAKGTLVPDKSESVNFDSTENLFIEGDNLEVLKLLQKAYFGKIKMIYIDPPYNTGNDFVYEDDFKDSIHAYLKQTGQSDGNGKKLTTNPETNGRFHSAWLSMLYPRLFIARNLLADDGLIFVSIDDKEVHNLRMILNEIFGEENLVGSIVWKSKYGAGAKTRGIIEVHEYILVYAKAADNISSIGTPLSKKAMKVYRYKDEKYETRGPYGTWPLETTSMAERPNLRYPIIYEGEEIWPKKQWLWSKGRVDKALENNELVFNKTKKGTWSVRFKGYMKDSEGESKLGTPTSLIDDIYTQDGTKEFSELFEEKVFEFPKPYKLIQRLINFHANGEVDKDAIVLDFFAGSGTTAQAVLEQNNEDSGNRKFILVQLPELTEEDSEAYRAGYKTIADIAKERIRRVVKKIQEENKGTPKEKNTDLGFKAFKLDKSNYSIWEDYEGKDSEELKKQMQLFENPLRQGANELDVIYECIIKEGFGLNSKIEEMALKGNKVYKISDGESFFFICLDEDVQQASLDALKLDKETVFICFDHSLDDSKKVNLSLQCKLRTI